MANFDVPISPRIKAIQEKRKQINKNLRLNIERNKIITEYYKTHENEYPILKRAGYLYEWCTTREINIEDDDIFLGDAGPHCRTVHFDIEQTSRSWLRGCFGDTDERFRAAWQVPGSVWMDDEDRKWLVEAADYWEDHDIGATARGFFPPEFFARFPEGMNLKDLTGSYPGHFNPNYERAVTVSFGAVRQTAIEKLEELRSHTSHDTIRSELFYRAFIKVCDGMILMSKRYAEACREKALVTEDPERRAELLKMSDSCNWIIEHPARNLWEGFQTIFFYQYLLTADGTHWADSPGLIDSFLGPLLENDIKTGALTAEQAQELCDAFLLHIGDQIIMFPKPTNDQLIEAHKKGKTFYDLQGGMQNIAAGMLITLGGQKTDGSPDYNLATEMLLLSYYRLRVAEPSLALRINKDTPDRIWDIAVACSKRSGGMPQFNNDDVIIQTMLDKGVPLDDARRYAVFGCVEPAISGKEWSMASNCGSFGGGAGLLGLLQNCINGINPSSDGPDVPRTKKLYEYESFEELKAELERQIKSSLDYSNRLSHFAAFVFETAWPILSASMMTEGCLESGRDVSWGGAKYNGMGSMFNTVGTVTDSLMVIKKLIFDDKSVEAKDLYDALQTNWEGKEMLRQKILNEVPFYGNDNEEPDQIMTWITTLWADYFNNLPGVNNGTMNCGVLDLYWTGSGKFTGATADGRKAGDALSPSADPYPNSVKNGPLAYVKSVAKLPWDKMRCGGAINLRLDANSVRSDDAQAKVRQLIQSFFAMGGIQFHFTVADTEVMRAAQKNPQDYQDLVVRIAGFSAYFTHLPFDDQENYIARYEIAV